MPRIRTATPSAIAEACDRLRRGDLVAMPTETVYGLAGAALDERAIAAIFDLKGRPADNPLIVHVESLAQARSLAARWDPRADLLGQRFWPGPLTLVVPAGPAIPSRVTAGRGTVALRQPAHPIALELLRSFGSPIAAPSANRSGHVSPTSAGHVASEFPDSDLLILDAGPSAVGIESTVLDLSPGCLDDPSAPPSRPRLLRPGFVTREAIEEAIGPIEFAELRGQDASPGTSMQHYAPRSPASLVRRAELLRRLDAASEGHRIAALLRPPTDRADIGQETPATSGAARLVIPMPGEPEAYAARLYAALREADATAPAEILVESVPEEAGLWTAIADRLRRACWRA